MCLDRGKIFANLHFCIFAKTGFTPIHLIIIIKIYKYRLFYNSCFQKVNIAKCKNAKMQKCKNRSSESHIKLAWEWPNRESSERRVMLAWTIPSRVRGRQQVSRVDFRLKVKFLQCYRALSCVIVRYRAISDIAQKKCCIFAPQMRQKLQYPAVPCNIVQYRAIPCNTLHRAK